MKFTKVIKDVSEPVSTERWDGDRDLWVLHSPTDGG